MGLVFENEVLYTCFSHSTCHILGFNFHTHSHHIPQIPHLFHMFSSLFVIHFHHMGLSENRVYSQTNSHLIGIMISKTIGFRGTLFSDTPISNCPKPPHGSTSPPSAGSAARYCPAPPAARRAPAAGGPPSGRPPQPPWRDRRDKDGLIVEYLHLEDDSLMISDDIQL